MRIELIKWKVMQWSCVYWLVAPPSIGAFYGFLPSEKHNEDFFFFPRKLSKQVLSCFKCLTVKTVFLWCCWRAEVQRVGCSRLLVMYQWRLCFTSLCHKQLPTDLISQDQLFRKTSTMSTVVTVHTCCANVMSTTSRAKWLTAYHTYTFHQWGWKLCWSQVRISSE